MNQSSSITDQVKNYVPGTLDRYELSNLRERILAMNQPRNQEEADFFTMAQEKGLLP